MEHADPRKVMWRKILQSFMFGDIDKSGDLEIDEFKQVLRSINFDLKDDKLRRIFHHMDIDGDGSIELRELEKFFYDPLRPRDSIRVTMDMSLDHPSHFLRYQTWHIKSRPLKFGLKSGPNGLGAYLTTCSNSESEEFVQQGSKLMFINTGRVDDKRFTDISKMLELMPLPLELSFQSKFTLDRLKIPDKKGTFVPINAESWPETLSVQESAIVKRPHVWKKKEEHFEIEGVPLLSPHCKHCPSPSAWYLPVHLTMDNENYSMTSMVLAWFIMFLIILSTATYILQTLPQWEDWRVWQISEQIVSVVFSIEIAVRLASCRNVKQYLKDPWNIIDVCSILPFWVELITDGNISAKEIRTVRVLRLLRIVRLARKDMMKDIMDLYYWTFANSFYMLITLLGMAILTLIVVASFANLLEIGHSTMYGVCDSLSSWYTCDSQHSLHTQNNVTSRGECEVVCEGWNFGGCCNFDQLTGSCQLMNGSFLVNATNWRKNAASCSIRDEYRRRSEEIESPFVTVPYSIWWACFTMTSIGYGEIYPTTEAGQLLAVLASLLGLFFFALPVIVVGWNFIVAFHKWFQKKATRKFDVMLQTMNKTDVKQLFMQVNEVIGMALFTAEDELIFLDSSNRLNTKTKVEQLLSFENGWGYLPFSTRHAGDSPRISQFKLFVLFAIFGKTYQKNARSLRRQKRKFNFLSPYSVISPEKGYKCDGLGQWRS